MGGYYFFCFLKFQGYIYIIYIFVDNNKYYNYVYGCNFGCVFIEKCLDDLNCQQ